MIVPCSVDRWVALEGKNGRFVPGVEVVCKRCKLVEWAYAYGRDGVDDAVARALGDLRRGCPNGEENEYVEGK